MRFQKHPASSTPGTPKPRPQSERQGFRHKPEVIIRCPLCGVRCADTDTLAIHRKFCTGVAPV